MILADFRLPGRLRRVVAALTPVVCGEAAAAHGEAVADEAELFLRALPTHLRAGLVAGLATFEASAAAHPRHLGRTFSRLDRAEAARHFARWWEGPGAAHQLARGLKMMVAFGYYELPAVKAAMGYHPERWIAQAGQRRQEAWGPAIAAAEAAVLAPDPLVPRDPGARPAGAEVARAGR